MKRPEYTAVVTEIYAKALKEHRKPTRAEMERLEQVFSRDGFTQGYFNGDKKDMFGVRGESDREAERIFTAARRAYAEGEARRVPVHFYTMCRKDEPIRAVVFDDDGHKCAAEGPVPEEAKRQGLTETYLTDQMIKTGGTPYQVIENRARVDKGLFLPASAINDLRRKLISQLSEIRSEAPHRRAFSLPPMPRGMQAVGDPVRIYQIRTADQLSEDLAELRPDYLYVPVLTMAQDFSLIEPFREKGTVPVAVLPRIVTDDQLPVIYRALEKLFSLGVNEALIGNLGQIVMARKAGMKIRGDFGLNMFNSWSLDVLREAGFLSATASFELRLSQIRDLSKPLPVEAIVYGRLPLMISDQCVIKNSAGRCSCQNPAQMSDRMGSVFPVVQEFGCRNVIYNAHKLYLADKQEDICSAGLWGARLMFTTETARECVEVAKGYMGQSNYKPNVLTRGLYYRGVD